MRVIVLEADGRTETFDNVKSVTVNDGTVYNSPLYGIVYLNLRTLESFGMTFNPKKKD